MHQKIIGLSFAVTLCLSATEVELGSIDVVTSAESEVVKDVHGEEIKSADLAEALFKKSPSVSLIRRSGIANDIIVRGQKKDNISVTIDGTKVCGACPNRMDPPISHVLTNNIDYIEMNEGPYNVEDFGVLSADVKIHTLKPTKEWSGDVNLGFGSWDYQKQSFSLSGGSDTLRILLSGSSESSSQYKDGNGDDFVGQIQREIDAGVVPASAQFQPQYQDLDAYSKKTMMGKLFWEVTENQTLNLSYTANRSDDVLYPSSKMDALYDDSDIYNLEYTLKALGRYAKEVNIQLFKSTVSHPMSTVYRMMSVMDTDPDTDGVQAKEMTHALTTEVQGAKIKDQFDVGNHAIKVGLDYSLRNWDGGYYVNGNPLPESRLHSIYDVDTKNRSLFLEDTLSLNQWKLEMGMRYDNTEVTSANEAQQDNHYVGLNGYLFANYQLNEATKYFMGVGKSSRVPDAKELYWVGSAGNEIGTPTLDATQNYEFDLGVSKNYDDGSFTLKGFYSKLKDFIAFNASNGSVHNYENVDATLYGVSLKGTYFATEALYFDYGFAYQYGKKDSPLTGESGTNMPEIPPFKLNLGANYAYDDTMMLQAEFLASGAWSRYDAENGEQALSGYGMINLKANKQFSKHFNLTVGVDNLFDKAYAVSNTYKDLSLLTTGGENNVMLMNEPGRYVYTNIQYKF